MSTIPVAVTVPPTTPTATFLAVRTATLPFGEPLPTAMSDEASTSGVSAPGSVLSWASDLEFTHPVAILFGVGTQAPWARGYPQRCLVGPPSRAVRRVQPRVAPRQSLAHCKGE